MAKWNPISSKAPDGIQPDFEFDLKGEVCPYTFVKSKLALQVRQVYAVEFDDAEGADSGGSQVHRGR